VGVDERNFGTDRGDSRNWGHVVAESGDITDRST